MGTKNKKTYEGTILDNLNPDKSIDILDSLIKEFGTDYWNKSPDEEYKFEPRYKDEERDALRHYIGTQVIADKYGPNIAKIITDLNEYPYDSTDIQKKVDKKNNKKALEDFIEGNMFDPSWLKLVDFSKEENSATILDSLLKHLTIPPKGGDYDK